MLTRLTRLTAYANTSSILWRLNLAGLSSLLRQSANREMTKGGGATRQHAGP